LYRVEAVLVASETGLVLPSQRFAGGVFAGTNRTHPALASRSPQAVWSRLAAWGGCILWMGNRRVPVHGKGEAGEVRLGRELVRLCRCECRLSARLA